MTEDERTSHKSLNREQRRHPETVGDPAFGPPHDPQSANRELVTPSTPQDTYSPRTKGSGHGKKTADKWNQ